MTKKTLLGQLEQAIMDAVWEHQPLTVRDVLDRLSAQRPIAYTTVMTVMNRLQRQGFLKRHMGQDGAYEYRPTSSRQEFFTVAAKTRAGEMVKRYGDAALVQFLDTLDHIPDGKLQQLRQQLRQRRK
jgi:predicted transcriptional regulator